MSDELTASYERCRQIARHSASNFYYSFLLLPRAKRRAMCALYAFLRYTDDLGDNSQPIDSRRKALCQWRDALEAAAQGRFEHPILPALEDTICRFEIPREYLHAVIDGVESDLDSVRFATFCELEQYCRRVASAVGLACIHIWGFTSAAALEPAGKCGLAFQLTNILRDLREDAARDRVYLPDEDLRRFDYTVGDLKRGVADRRFQSLMEFEIDRAERYYAEARGLERWLEPDGRRIFTAMLGTYRGLLEQMKRSAGDVLTRRVRLTSWQKLHVAARALFGCNPYLVPAAAESVR